MQEPTKSCTKCALVKPRSEFGKRAAKKDGLRSQCRRCDADYRAANAGHELERGNRWRQENRELVREAERRRYWANPEKARAKVRRWIQGNSEQHNARRRKRHDPVRARVAMQAWRTRNPDAGRRYWESHRVEAIERTRRYRARKRSVLNVPFTTTQLALRLSMFAGCWVCREPRWTEVDHVKPLAAGGAHCLSNLRPICRSCNASKQDTWPYSRPRA